jgi:hypothetical protein
MSVDDNEKWLQSIAGRRQADDPDMAREVDTIRAYFHKTSGDAQPVDDARRAARQARMHQWLRERGAYATTPSTSVPDRFTGRVSANRAWYAVAATVLLAVFTVPMVRSLLNEEPDGASSTMRGTQDIQKISVQDPAAVAAQLQQSLSAYGAPVRRLDKSASIRLETRIPEAKIEDARALLAPYKVNVPANGVLILQLTRRP